MCWRHVFLVVSASLAGCGGGDGEALLGTLERDRVELIAEAQEPIVELAVREGQAVAVDQLLLRLDPRAAEDRLVQARAAAAQAERRHAELVSGPRVEQRRQARALAEGAAARALAESSEFARIETLVERGLLSASTLDRQRALKDGTLAEQQAAAERLAELERGTRSEVLEQAAAAVDQARGLVAELELAVTRHAVRAPRAGVIDALPYEFGERPPRGAPVAVLLAAGPPHARVYVPQPRRAAIVAGTRATILIDGSTREWQGEVRYVSAEAAFTPYYALNERDRSRLSYLAEVVLTDADAVTLPAGLPVEVRLPAAAGGS